MCSLGCGLCVSVHVFYRQGGLVYVLCHVGEYVYMYLLNEQAICNSMNTQNASLCVR